MTFGTKGVRYFFPIFLYVSLLVIADNFNQYEKDERKALNLLRAQTVIWCTIRPHGTLNAEN